MTTMRIHVPLAPSRRSRLGRHAGWDHEEAHAEVHFLVLQREPFSDNPGEEGIPPVRRQEVEAVTSTPGRRRTPRHAQVERVPLPPRRKLRTPAKFAADLGPQIIAVAGDIPRFLVAPLLRPWHRRWGATADEVAAAMPGDGLLPHAQYQCTRAITIAAPPAEVWPWLVQVGYRRAGWYADDLLDNFGWPSAREILPEFQDLHVGQYLAWVPRASERSAFRVDDFVVPEWLLWRSSNRTWAWRLVPLPGGQTRLINRMHTVYEWSRPGWVLGTVLLCEVADYAMMRRMLRGIRDRAETEHRRPAAGLSAAQPREALTGDVSGA
jgi:hypothetical protein